MKNFKKGFTLLEILITVAIVGIISSVVVYSFSKYADSSALDATNNLVISTLSQARSMSVSAKVGSPFGVHFDTKSVTIFSYPYLVTNSKNW